MSDVDRSRRGDESEEEWELSDDAREQVALLEDPNVVTDE